MNNKNYDLMIQLLNDDLSIKDALNYITIHNKLFNKKDLLNMCAALATYIYLKDVNINYDLLKSIAVNIKEYF